MFAEVISTRLFAFAKVVDVIMYLTRAKDVVITQFRIGHTKANLISCLQHLLDVAELQDIRDEHYTVHTLETLFETVT